MNEKTCGYCKHFAQGAHCSFCANEKQTDKRLREYAYYPFSCELFEQGIHQSRIDFMNDDFKQKVASTNQRKSKVKWYEKIFYISILGIMVTIFTGLISRYFLPTNFTWNLFVIPYFIFTGLTIFSFSILVFKNFK